MQVLADENIPYAQQVLGQLGDVRLMPGRDISRGSLGRAELLFVRSITRVNRELIEGTNVRFVATATIGVDHIDQDYLLAAGIGFASAPGCNANSVAEYVTSALLLQAQRGSFRLAGKTIGVAGVGNVGRRVVQKAQALKMIPILNDPPLARQTGEKRCRPLEELLDADIITFHTPLTRTGPDATFHLCNAELLSKLKPGCIVINTSRGAVADGGALKAQLETGRLSAVLDVWEGEPSIDIGLMKLASVATPHIAGYSFDGKVNGTMMVYRAACEFLGIEPKDVPLDLPAPEPAHLAMDASGRESEDMLREAALACYDIQRDDTALRGLSGVEEAGRGAFFDRLRKEYPVRREFPSHTIKVKGAAPELQEQLNLLGFNTGSNRPGG